MGYMNLCLRPIQPVERCVPSVLLSNISLQADRER